MVAKAFEVASSGASGRGRIDPDNRCVVSRDRPSDQSGEAERNEAERNILAVEMEAAALYALVGKREWCFLQRLHCVHLVCS